MGVAVASVIGITAGSLMGIEATRHIINRVVWTILPFHQYEPPDAMDLRHKKLIDRDQYLKVMRQYGYDKNKAGNLFDATYRLLEIGDLIRLKWRGELTEEEFNRRMEKNRIKKEERELIEKASLYFPSPTDLVRYAVREVFTPEVVEKFQLDKEIPPKFLELSKKAGLTEEIATWSWRAHWVLPALTMGYEMFHRGIIDKNELQLLMKTQDIMPYWRDKLIEMSYKPLTRVDIRRIYDMGILDRDRVVKAYMEDGYSPENAEIMTKFTERYVMDEERQLSKSQIRRTYKIGEFTFKEAVMHLGTIGYSKVIAEFIVSLWEHELQEEILDAKIDVATTRYVDGAISIDEFRDRIKELNLTATREEKIITEARHKVLKKIKMPSKADLIRFLKNKTIDESGFHEYMRKLGYEDKEISLYIKDIGGE